jgi:hypothetical protein
MAGWIRLRAEDLDVQLAPDQLQGILEAAAGRQGEDPLPRLVESIVAQIRAAVRSGKTVPLSADSQSVPEELWSDGCALLLERLQGRLPALRLSADQVRAADGARQRLRRVERGELQVSRPADPLPSSSPVRIRCLHRRLHQLEFTELEGL